MEQCALSAPVPFIAESNLHPVGPYPLSMSQEDPVIISDSEPSPFTPEKVVFKQVLWLDLQGVVSILQLEDQQNFYGWSCTQRPNSHNVKNSFLRTGNNL